MLPKELKGRLLDIGCYKGYLRDYLPSSIEYVGLDIDKHFLEVIQCDLNNGILPFKDKIFDFVVAVNVLEHLFYPEKICKEIRRVLKDNGMAIISLPNDKGLNSIYACLFEEPKDFEIEKYSHHWEFTIKTARNFIGRYFKIRKMGMYNGQILSKFDFILQKFPSLCSNIYMLVEK